MKMYDFTAENGVPFRVIMGKDENYTREPVVKFYDRRHHFTPNGQYFGASYYVSTLMDDYERLAQTGLNLHGGVPDWQIGARDFRTLANWILEMSA